MVGGFANRHSRDEGPECALLHGVLFVYRLHPLVLLIPKPQTQSALMTRPLFPDSPSQQLELWTVPPLITYSATIVAEYADGAFFRRRDG
jgi:hypothetical protein